MERNQIILRDSCSFTKNPRFNKNTQIYLYGDDATLADSIDECIGATKSATITELAPFMRILRDPSFLSSIVDTEDITGISFGTYHNYNQKIIQHWYAFRDVTRKNHGYYLFINMDRLFYLQQKMRLKEEDHFCGAGIILLTIVGISLILTVGISTALRIF
jgi:hypothetical protein